MAYVAPSGKIELMKNVPLTPDYENTLWFANVSAQNAYFSAKVSLTFNNQMYTRVSDGVCRVEGEAELLKEYNYMRFNNNIPSGIGVTTKTYYAFITNVEYINNNVTEISFEIDEIQTWLFETSFAPCMIERQHTLNDQWGSNLVPEEIDIKEYVTSDIDYVIGTSSSTPPKYCYLLGIDCLAFPNETPGEMPAIFTQVTQLGTFSGTRWVGFPKTTNGETGLNNLIRALGNYGQLPVIGDTIQIHRLYIVPQDLFFSSDPADTGTLVAAGGHGKTKGVNKPQNFVDERGLINTPYVPKNNKMLTHPFVYYSVDCVTGKNDYKYELNTASAQAYGSTIVQVYGVVSDRPMAYINVQYYDGEYLSPEYSMCVDDFPSIPVCTNGVEGMLVSEGIKALGSLAKSYFQYEFGSVPTTEMMKRTNEYTKIGYAKNKKGGLGKRTSVDKVATESQSAHRNVPMIQKQSVHLPDFQLSTSTELINGTATSLLPIMARPNMVGLLVAPCWDVRIVKKQLRYDFAVMYDHYLSKYGYAIHDINVPNIHARQNWTYVKTDGCVVLGNVPTSARTTIENAMDRGITYWANGNIGAYGDFTNNPLGQG